MRRVYTRNGRSTMCALDQDEIYGRAHSEHVDPQIVSHSFSVTIPLPLLCPWFGHVL
jgi:hypothetical protein